MTPGHLLLLLLAAADDAPITSYLAVRLSGSFLRDVTASRIGGELGGNISITPRFDFALAVSIGSAPGARAGVTWHLKDDGEWVRPFVQARGIFHPVREGMAGGAGVWAGVYVPAGPGRVHAGGIFEGYLGPPGYVPWAAFIAFGYELDLIERIERAGVRPTTELEGTTVPPLKEPQPVPLPAPPPLAPMPKELDVVEKPAPAPAPPEERTRVVTRVSLARDLVYFDERKTSWVAKSDATVRKLIDVLKRYPQIERVEVQGHADDADTDDECLALSLKRAERVMAELLSAGIEPTRLTAKGYGRTKNRVPIKAPARKREPNRRVELNVLQEAW
ncbi:MAG: OmpA family protein [Myxococcaceae bacterium]|nr:OmpA family protein [Myxococcaceae bacterium]